MRPLPKLGPNSPLRGKKRGKLPSALVPLESHDQANIFAWSEIKAGTWPELHLMYAVPNSGGYTGGFKANRGRVAKMLKQGVRSGVPDICLPVARGGYIGFYMELKRPGEKPSDKQLWWHENLRSAGHYVTVREGFTAGIEALTYYLQGKYVRFAESIHPTGSRAGGPTSLIGE